MILQALWNVQKEGREKKSEHRIWPDRSEGSWTMRSCSISSPNKRNANLSKTEVTLKKKKKTNSLARSKIWQACFFGEAMKTQAISYKLVGVQVETTKHGSHLSISSKVANLCALCQFPLETSTGHRVPCVPWPHTQRFWCSWSEVWLKGWDFLNPLSSFSCATGADNRC